MKKENVIYDTDEIEARIDSIENDYEKMQEILNIQSPELRLKMLDKLTDAYSKNMVVISLPEDMIVDLMKYKRIEKNDLLDFMDIDKCLSFVQNNIEVVLEWLEVDGNIKKKAQDLQSIFLTNASFFKQLYSNSELLNDRIFNKFSIDKINHFSNYPRECYQVVNMSEDELQVFSECIKDFEKNCNAPLDWTPLAEKILKNIKEYESLLNDLNLEEVDYGKLSAIIQDSNKYKIETKFDYETIENRIKQQCDVDIKSDDISKKKNALIMRNFGYDIDFANKLLKKFGGDLESLPDSNQKEDLIILKEILEETNKQSLEERYNDYGDRELRIANKSLITRNYQYEYFKLYQDTEFDIKKGKEVAENVYEVGTDFSFVITVTQLSSLVSGSNNYKDTWNISKNEVQHFCCSYIRNDMLGYWKEKKNYIIYAFKPDPSIMIGAGPNTGLSSNRNPEFTLNVDEEQEKYYSPNTMINNTHSFNLPIPGYSEIDAKVNKNGKQIPTQFLIVFREKGKIINGEQALKAQNDWKSKEMPNGLPILIIDKDECQISEMEKLANLINKYKEDENIEIAKEMYFNIRNNLQSDENYLPGTDFTIKNVPQMEDNKICFSIEEFANNVLEKEQTILELLKNRKIEYENTEKQVIGEKIEKEDINNETKREEIGETDIEVREEKEKSNEKEYSPEELNRMMDITNSDLAENYRLTTPEERKNVFEIFKSMAKGVKDKIKSILGKKEGEVGDNGDGR